MKIRMAVLLCLCGLAIAAGPAPREASRRQESQTAVRPPSPTAQWDKRLAALTPDTPEAYFNLGEDVLDADRSADSQRLATRLFVLAYNLDQGRGGSQSLAASSCLALAELSGNRSEREWLRALALQIDPRRDLPVWVRHRPPATSEATDYQVAVAVGLTRTGDGAFARQLLRKPEVRDRLDELDRMARRMGISGGADGIAREASRWPCPSCQNTRYEKRSSSLLGEAKLCSNCKGKPGQRLSRSEFISMLRFESWLLAGTKRTWASQVTVDMGEPLADLDPAALPRLLGVDASRAWFREGRWVQTADGDLPAPDPRAKPGGEGEAPKPPPQVGGS